MARIRDAHEWGTPKMEVYITRVTRNTGTAQINHDIGVSAEELAREALAAFDATLEHHGRHAERGGFDAVEITTRNGFRGRTRSTVKIVRKL
jgi:hypothetical protein